ncbi:valine--pyruvate transaminase [Gayadomonas joobiniege]|uniref:valine--pyruvate transaminase n=1 Tax=Gayadomonas joobiniege TaxID=1234606 RepID=UPI0003825908|nr:valine--pyruvate transaminase [Gayadomonas joobiniege]
MRKVYSNLGQQLCQSSGIVDLMQDLGDALNENPDILFLGGGNPADIPEFKAKMHSYLSNVLQSPEKLHKLLGVYQSPQGDLAVRRQLAVYFKQLGWPVSEDNLALANGSQSIFFALINMLAGQCDEQKRQLLFPMAPEYLGYADQALGDEYFTAVTPKIELIGEHEFKYHIDFDKLVISNNIAALCISSPANPSGNLVSHQELARLDALAEAHQIPLIIDCAYGSPFPGIVYEPQKLPWLKNAVYVFSLSKLGLPACRTGIILGNTKLIKDFVQATTVMNLATASTGMVLLNELLEHQALDIVCQQIVQPYYRKKRDFIIALIKAEFSHLDYRIHLAQGAFFIWLWLPKLKITSSELYQILKQQGVLVMDGAPFFFAIKDDYAHKQQCLRLSYCQEESVIQSAIRIIKNTVEKYY